MPPKKYPNFPSKAERDSLMEQLRQAEQSGDALTAGEHYKNYVSSLRKLNETMDRYYTPDGDGTVPTLEQAGKDELMASILETATLGETFLADVAGKGGNLTTAAPGLVGQVQAMMSQDYETLSLYDPANDEMTLPEIQQDARTQVIDLRGVQIGKLGNMQSSRLPMTVVDETGGKRRGVFTKASHVSVLKPFRQMLDTAIGQCTDPEGKAQLGNMIQGYRSYLQKKGAKLPGGVAPKDAGDEMIVGKMIQQLMWERKTTDVPTVMKRAGVDLNKVSVGARSTLMEGITGFVKEPAYWVNGLELGLKDGDRLDQRNSAMSAVAGLLGVPKLVARSNNMKFLDEDGKVVEGTFMDFAEGMDLEGGGTKELYSHVSDEPFDDPESNLNRDLADMQVLDFICGNVDRHAGNLFYDVDTRTGKIKGVQGIDNDSAFGLYSSGKNGSNFRLEGTDSLKVISQGMAKKVSSLSPEMLKFTLRGRGLTDAEIDAACHRLGDVQKAVKEASVAKGVAELMQNGAQNKLSIMSEDDMKGMSPNAFTGKGRNLFGDVATRIGDSLEEAREHGINFRSEEKQQKKTSKLKEVSTTGRRFTAAGIGESLRGMSRMIRNEVTGFAVGGLSKFLRSSGKFRTMVSSVKAADALSARLKKEVGKNGILDRDDPKVKAQLDQADRAMEEVRKSTEAYLQKKMQEKGVQSLDQLRGKSAYEQKRIDYAKKVMENVKEYDRIAHPEKAEEKAEKEAVQDRVKLARQRKQKQPEAKPEKGPEIG